MCPDIRVQTQIKLTRNITHQAITEFHQQLKTEIAHMLEQTKADLIASVVKAVLAELRQATREQDKATPGPMSTAIENQTTAKIIPLRRRTNPKIYVKAAAMLLAALLPMATVYFFILKPQENHSQAVLTLQKERNNNEPPASIETLRTLIKSREFDKAEALLPQALEAAQFAQNRTLQSELLYFQGRILSNRSEFQAAIKLLQKSLELAADRPESQLAPLFTLASIHHALDQNQEARDKAAKVVEMATRLGNPLNRLAGLHLLGISEFLVSRSPQAEISLQQAIDLAREQQNFYYLPFSLAYLGVIRTEQHRFKDANQYFRQATMTAEKVTNNLQRAKALAIVYGYYARSLAVEGKYNKAADYYQLAIAYAREANDQQALFISQLHYGLSDCLKLQGQHQQSVEILAKAKKLETQAAQQCEHNNTFLSVALNRRPLVCIK